ncbi:MAG TPA: DUF1992 domain-containing protein [Syntrophomonadaceae bacterium]|nr:DUF1992 domain-containing protein [Syntrophomonadaceae bacterium]
MEEKPIEEQVMIAAQKSRKLARYMSSTQDLVEDQIQKAFKRGDFDNLPGKGKPLDLHENPFEPPELRMAFKILKNNDFAPYWIELGKEIDFQLDKLDKEVDLFSRYTRIFVQERHANPAKKRFKKRKSSFYYETRLHLEKIALLIKDYNIHCPTYREARANLVVNDMMYKIITQIEQIIEENSKDN